MKKNKKIYCVDFESWQFEAETRTEVFILVFSRLFSGKFPKIVSVENSHRPSLKEFDEYMKNNVN